MARDAAFFFQLGFEHGFSVEARSRGQSYPRRRNYTRGWAAGVEFAGRVTQLAPTVTQSEAGVKHGACTVTFEYVWLAALEPARKRSKAK